MRVCIAGCGDLGSRVAHTLLEDDGNEVWGLRRHPPASAKPDMPAETGVPAHPRMQWIAGDMTRPQTLTDLPAGITHLIFTAAPGERSEAAYRATYLAGLQNIVKAIQSPALKRIIFISSTAVYGDHGDEWVTENTPVDPKGFNGQVLCEAEQWLEQLQHSTHISTISLRLSGIYGPGRTYLLDRLRQGLASAATQPAHWVNRIHIEDATAAIVYLLQYRQPQSVYLVTDSTPLPMRTLYEALAQLVKGPIPPEGAPPRGVGSKRLSNARLLDTGFVFKWPDSRKGHAALL